MAMESKEYKCTICGKSADYRKDVDGKETCYCEECAEKEHGMITLWSKKCQHCIEWLNPEYIVAMYNKEYDDWWSYCSTDCAMRDLGYTVLDDEELDDEELDDEEEE